MKIKKILLFLLTIVAGGGMIYAAPAKPLTLAKAGKTDYKIIAPATPSKIDTMAVKELNQFLKQATGAEFKVIAGDSAGVAKLTHRLFVGLSPVALEILGNNPVAKLKDQEHIVKRIGNDIFLYGKGEYGNIYAVYTFLENQLGCRWYTVYGDMKIPFSKTLELGDFDYSRNFAFKIRALMNWFYVDLETANRFFYRNFQNQLLIKRPRLPGVKSVYNEVLPGCHSAFSYIPPGGGKQLGTNSPLPWLKDKKYFTTNPNFFSVGKKGKRVNNRQLCFSNPALRKELTKNLERRLNETGGKSVISIDATDRGEKFCYCPDCIALEKKYQTPGGPLFDYVLELCSYFKQKYPEAYVITMAYRKEQTEKPPVGIDKLPDNLIIKFAPIYDNLLAPLSDPSNAETYKRLKRWCELSDHVWVWYYVNPYNPGRSVPPPPPVGNLERLVKDIKLLKAAGVEGTYFEHDSGVPYSANFSELQTWLMLKLFQDPNQDSKKLIKEFTDYYYGKAAPLMRQYMAELEQYRKQLLAAGDFWTYLPNASQYTYLTPENIINWERMFDKMEKVTAKNPEHQFHVKLVRMSLDVAFIRNVKKITAQYPKLATPLNKVIARLEKTDKKMLKLRVGGRKTNLSKWINNATLEAKPLPAMFDKYPADALHQVNPNFPNELHQRLLVKDPDAAWGIANFENEKSALIPFGTGFYDKIDKKMGISIKIPQSAIIPDVYKFYKIGTTALTSNCIIWGGRWYILVGLGHLYSVDNPSAKYEVYVSLKFEGPGYGGKGKVTRVLCDRVVLIDEAAAKKYNKPLNEVKKLSNAVKTAPALPAKFANKKTHQIFLNSKNVIIGKGCSLVKDPMASTQTAALYPITQLPFKFGYYDKKQSIHANSTIKKTAIVTGKYHCYKIATTRLSKNGYVWFGKWYINVRLGDYYNSKKTDQKWDIYAMIRFEGASYGGSGADEVYIDRVFIAADPI
jgi:hypothetical protein